jgi:hypothetical protein
MQQPSRKRRRANISFKAKPPPISGFYGVIANGKRWLAYIHYDSKRHTLGSFDTKQEAALAYDRAAREHGGGKKQLNYESINAAEEAAAQAQASEEAAAYTAQAQASQPRPRPSSGFYGVQLNKKRWLAYIYYDSKRHILGTFDTKQEAALAYDRAARGAAREHGGGMKFKKQLNYESIKTAEEAAAQAQAGHTLVARYVRDRGHRLDSGKEGG